MSIFEYNPEAHMRVIREEGREEGAELITTLVHKMLVDGRMDELRQSTTDAELRGKLLREYGMLKK